jgi:hypothetical protein
MRWASNVRQVGRGRMSIVNSVENQEVESILDMNGRATLNSRMDLRPGRGSTSVAWTVSAACADGWINVPCRYMNLVMRGMVEHELDNGLSRLKTLTEQLPNVNFEGLHPQFDNVEPQSFVYSVVETSASDLTELVRAEGIGIEQVRNFMNDYHLTAAGPLVRVVTGTNPQTQRMSFRVGYPFAGAPPTTVVGVQVGQTPSGEAMHVLVEGSRAQVRMAYEEMYAYLQAHRIPMREGGLPWEVVQDPGTADGSTPTRIEIFMPLQ